MSSLTPFYSTCIVVLRFAAFRCSAGVLYVTGSLQIFIDDDAAAAAADDDDDNELGLVSWINTELFLLCHLITVNRE